MKRFIIAVILILVLASSFVAGFFISQAQAGRCTTFCDICTCHKMKCCNGVCVDLGPCGGVCPVPPC